MKDLTAKRLTKRKWDTDNLALARKIMGRFGFVKEDDKEDVIQEFASNNPTFESFKDKSEFSTWLHAGLYHQSCDFARKHYHLRHKIPPTFEYIDEPVKGEEGDTQKQLADPRKSRCFEERHVHQYEFQRYAGHGFTGLGIEGIGAFRLTPEEIQTIENHIIHCDYCQGISEVNRLAYDDLKEYDKTHGIEDWDQIPFHVGWELFEEDASWERKNWTEKDLMTYRQNVRQVARLEDGAAPRANRQRKCSNCNKPGHYAKKCTEPSKAL